MPIVKRIIRRKNELTAMSITIKESIAYVAPDDLQKDDEIVLGTEKMMASLAATNPEEIERYYPGGVAMPFDIAGMTHTMAVALVEEKGEDGETTLLEALLEQEQTRSKGARKSVLAAFREAGILTDDGS